MKRVVSGIVSGFSFVALAAGIAPAQAQTGPGAASGVPPADVVIIQRVGGGSVPSDVPLYVEQFAPNLEKPNGVWHSPDVG